MFSSISSFFPQHYQELFNSATVGLWAGCTPVAGRFLVLCPGFVPLSRSCDLHFSATCITISPWPKTDALKGQGLLNGLYVIKLKWCSLDWPRLPRVRKLTKYQRSEYQNETWISISLILFLRLIALNGEREKEGICICSVCLAGHILHRHFVFTVNTNHTATQ